MGFRKGNIAWNKGLHKTTDLAARFWPKVQKTNNCWLWCGSRMPLGYGKISAYDNGKPRQLLAHRVSYELLVGAIPVDMTIDHLCKNPPCVNPEHLEVVTQRENILRSNSWCAKRAKATHCIHGHELSGNNLINDPHGWRYCRTCQQRRARERYAKKKNSHTLPANVTNTNPRMLSCGG